MERWPPSPQEDQRQRRQRLRPEGCRAAEPPMEPQQPTDPTGQGLRPAKQPGIRRTARSKWHAARRGPAALRGGVAAGGRERGKWEKQRIPRATEAAPRGIQPLRKKGKKIERKPKRKKFSLLERRRRRSFCAGRKADSQVGSHPSGRCPKQFGPGLPNLEAQSQSQSQTKNRK